MEYYIVHIYRDKEYVVQYLGYTVLANEYTFRSYIESLEKGLKSNISFIPVDGENKYIEGHYFFDNNSMMFGLHRAQSSYILIDVGNIDNINLITLSENKDLNRTKEFIDSLDKNRIKKILEA